MPVQITKDLLALVNDPMKSVPESRKEIHYRTGTMQQLLPGMKQVGDVQIRLQHDKLNDSTGSLDRNWSPLITGFDDTALVDCAAPKKCKKNLTEEVSENNNVGTLKNVTTIKSPF